MFLIKGMPLIIYLKVINIFSTFLRKCLSKAGLFRKTIKESDSDSHFHGVLLPVILSSRNTLCCDWWYQHWPLPFQSTQIHNYLRHKEGGLYSVPFMYIPSCTFLLCHQNITSPEGQYASY
jgi:hypothetical protein